MPTLQISKLVEGVTENGDLLVFNVESSNPVNPPYRVDLQKFCGNGDCDCPNFRTALTVNEKTMTKRQALVKGAMPSPSLECKHIRRAKRYWNFKTLNRVIENREREANENKERAKARTMGNSVPEAAREVETDDWHREDPPF